MKTKKEYEAYLNQLYADIYSASQAWMNFCYFKQGKIKYEAVNRAYNDHTLGSLFRKHDPIAFNVGYREFSTNKN